MPFVLKALEVIDKEAEGIIDNTHRHNYYTVKLINKLNQ